MFWLIGMMGTGKTTVGKLVAERLRIPFFDTDTMIAELAEMSVPSLWRAEGEAGFRAVERIVIERVPPGEGVTATGGGAVMDEQNARIIGSSAGSVWLRCDPEQIVERLEHLSDRPLLEGGSRQEQLKSILADRFTQYERLADEVVDTTDLPIDEVVDRVEGLWKG